MGCEGERLGSAARQGREDEKGEEGWETRCVVQNEDSDKEFTPSRSRLTREVSERRLAPNGGAGNMHYGEGFGAGPNGKPVNPRV